jgi:hypothetical protein
LTSAFPVISALLPIKFISRPEFIDRFPPTVRVEPVTFVVSDTPLVPYCSLYPTLCTLTVSKSIFPAAVIEASPPAFTSEPLFVKLPPELTVKLPPLSIIPFLPNSDVTYPWPLSVE